MKAIFLDTETTGNIPGKDRLCSLCYKDGDLLVHELFKPPVPISIDAMATHHITTRMVEDKLPFEGSDTKKNITELLTDNILVAHNASFDIAMLEAEGVNVPKHICTLRVARHLDTDGKIPRFSLQYLRYFLDLNIEDAPAHDARGDVLVLEALFVRLIDKVMATADNETAALEKMIELSQQPVLLRTMKFGKYRGTDFKDIAVRDASYLQWLLGEKQKQASMGVADPSDEDLIHTLQYYLA